LETVPPLEPPFPQLPMNDKHSVIKIKARKNLTAFPLSWLYSPVLSLMVSLIIQEVSKKKVHQKIPHLSISRQTPVRYTPYAATGSESLGDVDMFIHQGHKFRKS
jgi:hypothetical protein